MSAEDSPDAPTPPVTGVRANRRAKSAPTIYDIARLAEVNPSTVSRALSQPGRINIKTEQRIRSAAKQLNYRLNPMARALPTGRTSTIGLLVADITNPMFFTAVRGAERAAAERGYTLVLAESQESGAREAEAAHRVLPSVDALILVVTRLSDEAILELADRKPLVVINRMIDGVSSLVPDVDRGIAQALNHLAELRHTAVAFVAGPETSWMSGARARSLRAQAPGRGMTIVEIGPGAPTLDGGRDALDRVLAADVTAVVAYNDLMAIGLMRAATAQGIAVPGQLSILGFDDIFGSDFTSPPLTTIRIPLGLAGDLAVRRALDMIDADAADTEYSTPDEPPILTELVIRGSVGPAPR
ncbi:LacI family DNA-binding transcriptional regulator [Planctomonas psychrotolerans]|uniref:LacI family DNA-binding transcriptional regulator n=1 Tax=Planctomonas psychrotolerans TaxID=2528712 RepID=UPI001238DD11|nr:LacI family DNA-binding transcriptional regulator [Planctomonas psychrotolerans]